MITASTDATADALVNATYGLVIATALLVIATGVPIFQRIREGVRRKRSVAAEVVPDLNMLLSRVRGTVDLLLTKKSAPLSAADHLISDGRTDQRIASDLKDRAASQSLEFSNEIYIAVHFLTMALGDMYILARTAANVEGKASIHDLDKNPPHHHSSGNMSVEARVAAVCAHYKAVELSLVAAEALLPKSARTIQGGTFWDRYSTQVDARQQKAEQDLVSQRAQARKAK
ncbi:hypothetical protein [Demequina aurantiaca]|uniref:hypothetical protein n=1 Tax=Demequina aurantiaca TaxID=676200 RepID=UPI003D34FCEA